MSLRDSRGCPVWTRSAASLARFEQALELSVSYRLDPLAVIQGALEADPDFAKGHCLPGGLGVMASGGMGAIVEWTVNALGGAVVGLVIGGIIAAIVRQFTAHPEELVVE